MQRLACLWFGSGQVWGQQRDGLGGLAGMDRQVGRHQVQAGGKVRKPFPGHQVAGLAQGRRSIAVVAHGQGGFCQVYRCQGHALGVVHAPGGNDGLGEQAPGLVIPAAPEVLHPAGQQLPGHHLWRCAVGRRLGLGAGGQQQDREQENGGEKKSHGLTPGPVAG